MNKISDTDPLGTQEWREALACVLDFESPVLPHSYEETPVKSRKPKFCPLYGTFQVKLFFGTALLFPSWNRMGGKLERISLGSSSSPCSI
jgi:hypothetical protein